MDPAFLHTIREWAANDDDECRNCARANVNGEEKEVYGLSDPLLTALGKLKVGATRLW